MFTCVHGHLGIFGVWIMWIDWVYHGLPHFADHTAGQVCHKELTPKELGRLTHRIMAATDFHENVKSGGFLKWGIPKMDGLKVSKRKTHLDDFRWMILGVPLF